MKTTSPGQVASSGAGIEPAEGFLKVVQTNPASTMARKEMEEPNEMGVNTLTMLEEPDTSSELDVINISRQNIEFDLLQPELTSDLLLLTLVIIGNTNWASYFTNVVITRPVSHNGNSFSLRIQCIHIVAHGLLACLKEAPLALEQCKPHAVLLVTQGLLAHSQLTKCAVWVEQHGLHLASKCNTQFCRFSWTPANARCSWQPASHFL